MAVGALLLRCDAEVDGDGDTVQEKPRRARSLVRTGWADA
jgi:hypothetical protein